MSLTIEQFEILLASHTNFLCEKLVSSFNTNNNNMKLIIVGGRLLKYLTPLNKIFDKDYYLKTNDDGKQLLKSYDTDTKLYIYNNVDDNNFTNLFDKLVNYFVDGFFNTNLRYLELTIYFLNSLLNQNNFELNIDLDKLTTLNYDSQKNYVKNNLIKTYIVKSEKNYNIPIIRIGLKIKNIELNTDLYLFIFDCSINMTMYKGEKFINIYEDPINYNNFLSIKTIDNTSLQNYPYYNNYNNILILNLKNIIKEFYKLLSYGTSIYTNGDPNKYRLRNGTIIDRPYKFLNKYTKLEKVNARLKYIKSLIEVKDPTSIGSDDYKYLNSMYILKDMYIDCSNIGHNINNYICEHSSNKKKDSIPKFLDYLSNIKDEAGNQLIDNNSIFNLTPEYIQLLYIQSLNVLIDTINKIQQNYMTEEQYIKMFKANVPYLLLDINNNKTENKLNMYKNSLVCLYTSNSFLMNVSVIKYQLTNNYTYINTTYPGLENQQINYTIVDYLYDLTLLFNKMKTLLEVLGPEADNIYVARGIGNFSFGNISNAEDANIGDTFLNITPISTTFEYKTSLSFYLKNNTECCVLKIKLQKDGKYIYTGNSNYKKYINSSVYPGNPFTSFNESEIILSPGTTFKIVNKYMLYGIHNNEFYHIYNSDTIHDTLNTQNVLVLEVEALQPNYLEYAELLKSYKTDYDSNNIDKKIKRNNNTTIKRNNNTTIKRNNNTIIKRNNNTAIKRNNNTAINRNNNTAIKRNNNTIINQNNNIIVNNNNKLFSDIILSCSCNGYDYNNRKIGGYLKNLKTKSLNKSHALNLSILSKRNVLKTLRNPEKKTKHNSLQTSLQSKKLVKNSGNNTRKSTRKRVSTKSTHMLTPLSVTKILGSAMNIKVYTHDDSVTISRDIVKNVIVKYNNNITLYNKLISKNNSTQVSNEYINRFYLNKDDIVDLMRVITDKKYKHTFVKSNNIVKKELLKYNSLLKKIESKLKLKKNSYLSLDNIKSQNSFFDNKYLEVLLKQL